MSGPCRSTGCDGEPWPLNHIPGVLPAALSGYCFTCAYWLDRVSSKHAGVVITEASGTRTLWEFDPERPIVAKDSGPLGFGGRRWIVRFFGGRTVETNNLWHCGDVPVRFWSRFAVNAILGQPPPTPRDGTRCTLEGRP